MKRVLVVFVSALVLNIVWENLHAVLYTSYKGGAITEFILLRASLFDAIVVTLMVLPFLYGKYIKNTSALIFIFGTIIAIANEWYGLSTNRWAYNALMPVVPVLNIGITPMLQLGLIGVVSYKFAEHFFDKKAQQKTAPLS